MGERVINIYKSKISNDQKFAFFISFFMVILVHLYKFANTLPNHDSLYNYYSNQNVLGSGRWALSAACGFSSYYDLPWVNGIFSALWIALTIVVIVTLFKMKNKIVILLTSGLIATAPATTETFFFLFTADGYMLAMLLGSLIVYFSRIEQNNIKYLILCILLCAVTCGIYQAYISFALILSVCYFMYMLFENIYDKKDYYIWIMRQVAIYGLGLLLYYVIWQILMKFMGVAPNDYQGISEIGQFSPMFIINGILASIKSVMMYFLEWNVLDNGFSLYSILSILFLIFTVIGVFISIKKSGIIHRKWAFILLVLCILSIIPFSCIWNFVSESVSYRPMMLMCLVILFIFTILLFERWCHTKYNNSLFLLSVFFIINCFIMSNISYFYMNLCEQRTYADGIEMMVKIHELQGKEKVNNIAIIGQRNSEVMWANNENGIFEPEKIHILSSQLETNLMYDKYHVHMYLAGTFNLQLPLVSDANTEELIKTYKLDSMPVWPNDGSMEVIDDTLILKLGEEKEGK